MVSAVRRQLSGADLTAFNDIVEHGASSNRDVDLSSLGIGLAIAGAATMLVALFLPLWDASSVQFSTLVETA